jgi:hypothetical protein
MPALQVRTEKNREKLRKSDLPAEKATPNTKHDTIHSTGPLSTVSGWLLNCTVFIVEAGGATIRALVAGFLKRRPCFNSRVVYVESEVNIVTLVRGFL